MVPRHNSTNKTLWWRVLKADSFWLWILKFVCLGKNITHEIAHKRFENDKNNSYPRQFSISN